MRIEPLINLLYDQGKNAARERGRSVATGLMIKPCDLAVGLIRVLLVSRMATAGCILK